MSFSDRLPTILAENGLSEINIPFPIVENYLKKHGVSENVEKTKALAPEANPNHYINPTEAANLSCAHINVILTTLCRAIVGGDPSAVEPCEVHRTPYLKLIAAVLESKDEEKIKKMTEALVNVLCEMYYVSIRPDVVELCRHLCANELIIIDLDALILDAMCNAHVDWQLAQSIHVAALVDIRLRSYLSRNAKIQLVTFQCHEWFYKKAPQLRLVRNAIVRMLSDIADGENLMAYSFTTYFGKEFIAHLDAFKPEAIMLYDGEQLLPDPTTGKRVSPLNCPEVSDAAAASLHRMALYLVTKRMHVCYASRQLHKDNDIWVFVCTAKSQIFTPLEAIKELLVKCTKNVIKQQNTDDEEELDEALLKKCNSASKKNTAAAIFAYAAHKLIAAGDVTPQEKDLLKVLVITAVVMQFIRLPARNQPVELCPAVSAILDKASAIASSVLENLVVRPRDYDVVDGHLAAVLASLLSKKSLGSLCEEDVTDICNNLWSVVEEEEEEADITSNPLKELQGVKAPLRDISEVPEEQIYDCKMLHELKKEFNMPCGSEPISNPTLPLIRYLEDWKNEERFRADNDAINEEDTKKQSEQRIKDMTAKWRSEEQARKTYEQKLQEGEIKWISSLRQTADSMGVEEVLSLTKNTSSSAPTISKNSTELLITERNTVEQLQTALKTCVERNNTRMKNYRQSMEKFIEVSKEACRRDLTERAPTQFLEEEYTRVATRLRQDESHLRDPTRFETLEVQLHSLLNKYPIGDDERSALFRFMIDCNIQNPVTFILTNPDAVKTFKDWGIRQGEKMNRLKSLESEYNKQSKQRNLKDADKEKLKEKKAEIDELKSQVVLNKADGELCSLRAQILYYCYYARYMTFRNAVALLEGDNSLWSHIKEEWRSMLEYGADPIDIWNNKDWMPVVNVWRQAHGVISMIQRMLLPVDDRDLIVVRAAFQNIDLPMNYIQMINSKLAKVASRSSLPAIPTAMMPRPALGIQYTAEALQLLKMGHLLQRQTGNPDPRVRFYPDDWQVQLLNIVEKGECAVVSAPTSSGKTFISYYCMEKVLETPVLRTTPDSEIGIAIYVAPTRALVNQAVADVYGRFKSKQYNGKAVHLFGACGGDDYGRHVFDCQILVTLPATLEAILLSPHHQAWVKRIRYVVFDEIHTMESNGEGAIWQRLMAMLPCPWVALSATLGDTKPLVDWLNRTLTRSGRKIAHIVPDANQPPIGRWSDIEKHVFLPTTTSGDVLDMQALQPFHPLSVVDIEMLTLKQAFPSDVTLVPRETMLLYQTMGDALNKEILGEYGAVAAIKDVTTRINQLNPSERFAENITVTQKEARQWEKDLKAELLTLVNLCTPEGTKRANLDISILGDDEEEIQAFHSFMKDSVSRILGSFRSNIDEREKEVETLALEGKASYPDTFQFVTDGIISLYQILEAKKMLPALVFNYDAECCQQIVEVMVHKLEQDEEVYRQSSKFIAYEKEMARAREANRQAQQSNSKLESNVVKDEDGNTTRERVELLEVRPDSDFDIPDVLPEFTLGKQTVDSTKLKELVADGKISEGSIEYRAIKRGIGIHSPTSPSALRSIVEVLFRERKLGVVVTTRGMALGIHSPCRTVVIAGDSFLLNVSEFRQMSGRAGRRGLDNIGHVVFLGIPTKKIRRLLTSDMANLRGHTMMDTTTNLRLLQLYSEPQHAPAKPADWQQNVMNYCAKGFTEPLFRCRMLSHDYTHHSIEFLQRMFTYFLRSYFIDLEENGNTVQTMPGNLLINRLNIRQAAHLGAPSMFFVSLLQKLSQFDQFDRNEAAKLAVAMLQVRFMDQDRCNVHAEIHRSALRDPQLAILTKRRIHSVVLPPFAPYTTKVMTEMAEEVLTIVSQWAVAMAKTLPDDLPLLHSQKRNADGVPLSGVLMTSDDSVAKLDKVLSNTATPSVARHPLLAVSGEGDLFTSVEDVLTSLRPGLFIDRGDIPVVDLVDFWTHSEQPFLLNASLFDFINHGSQKNNGNFTRRYLELFNGLSPSTSFAMLKSTFGAIQSLDESLRGVASGSQFVTAFSELAEASQTKEPELSNRASKK